MAGSRVDEDARKRRRHGCSPHQAQQSGNRACCTSCGHVELAPAPAVLVVVLAAQPGRAAAAAGSRARSCAGLRSPSERSTSSAAAVRKRSPSSTRRACSPVPDDAGAEERGEVDHAVEVAAHVRHAPEPGARQRHRGDRRHAGCTSLASTRSISQVSLADLHAELRRAARAVGQRAGAPPARAGSRGGKCASGKLPVPSAERRDLRAAAPARLSA